MKFVGLKHQEGILSNDIKHLSMEMLLNPISFNCTSSVNEVANNGAYGGQTYPTHMVNSLTQPTPMYNHVQTQTIGDKKKQLTETLEFRLIPNKRMYMLKVNFQMIVHKKWISREIAFIQIQKSY